MGYVISAYLGKELLRFPLEKRKEKVGVVEGDCIISPPCCPSCGAPCVRVKMDGDYLQCSECLSVYKEHRFNSVYLGDLYEVTDERKSRDGRKDS